MQNLLTKPEILDILDRETEILALLNESSSDNSGLFTDDNSVCSAPQDLTMARTQNNGLLCKAINI
jgi:hypothetical protein